MHEPAVERAPKARQTWTVRQAALIGIIGVILYEVLSFGSMRAIEGYGLALTLSRYEKREIVTFVSLVGVALILRPVVLLMVKRRRLGGWWDSIEWNGGRYVWQSVVAGAVLAMAWFFVAILRGAATSFRGGHLVLNVILYVTAEVVASAGIEEMYFRGILFQALAMRFNDVAAVVLSTFVFDLVHIGHWFDVLPAAVVLGIARLKTKSVASCFALHTSYNFFVLICMLAMRFRTG